MGKIAKERKYERIWAIIKKKGKIRLEIEPFLFARVKKMIIKEKYQDLGFKVLNDHDYFFLDISYDAEKKIASFRLRQRYGLEGVKG